MRHLAFVGFVLACTPNTPATAPEKPAEPRNDAPQGEAKLDVAEKPAADDERWRCSNDDDCTQTCALGAVNTAWLAAHPDADSCDDGCGWKSGQEACRAGACVTLDPDGAIDPACTKRDKPIFE